MQQCETNDPSEVACSSNAGVFESPAEQLALKLVEGQLTRLRSMPVRDRAIPGDAKPDTHSAIPQAEHPLKVLAATTGPGIGFWELTSRFNARIDLFEVEHYRYAKWIERALVHYADDPCASDDSLGSLVRQEIAKKAQDDFPRHQVQLTLANSAGGSLRLLCQADPPEDERYDIGVLVLRRDGTAEWTRDLLQRCASVVAEHGVMVVATDHHDDHWIGDQLRSVAKLVRRERVGGKPQEGATAYVVSKATMRLKFRNFDDQFAFRDEGRLIQVVSRPGVFSHRKLDLGARRLIDAMEILPNQRVLDIGCGSGVVGLAAALREPSARITGIDSHARAIQCTLASAKLNQVDDRLEAHLTSDGTVEAPGSYDVAVANAPYFANLRIAELFMESARKALRPGGRVWAVGKQPDWYQVNAPRWFDRVSLSPQEGGYWIMTGLCPASDAG